MNNIQKLIDLHNEIQDLWGSLEASNPATVELLKEKMSLIPESENAAKVELRKMGPGKHEVSGTVFTVKKGSVKSSFNIDDILDEAEDRGHLPQLIKAGFVVYAVNSKQISRLPALLKAVYSPLETRTVSTPRVTIPKLWK